MPKLKMWGNVPLERLSECPKAMTNGPCGGVGMDGSCEVDRRRLCVWYEALDRSGDPQVYQRNPAMDWSLDATTAWVDAFTGEQTSPPQPTTTLVDRAARPLRSGSRFERLLRAGHFVVTCEVNPRDSADAADLIEYGKTLLGAVDAAHVSDNSLSSPHMCGLAVAALLERLGLETILHLTCRDRNRMMLQADVLGAHALGVHNILCLTGDHPSLGDHPRAKPVFDLDSITFIDLVRKMRDEGTFESGRRLRVAPRVFIGGADAPTAPPLEFRAHRLANKIAAGSDFIVTQLVFDMELLAQHLQRVRDLGLAGKTYLLVGVGALSGPDMARAINKHTPGVIIPEHVIKRLNGVPAKRRRAEGIQICVEQVQQLRAMPGVCGIDLMDLEPETWFPTPEIVEAAGLLPRPALGEAHEAAASK